MRMYDYAEAYIRLESMLEQGEIDKQTYLDTIEGIEGDAFQKAENLGRMIDNFKAHADALKEEAKKLNDKRKTIENRIEWLTESLEMFLKATGKEQLQVGMYKLGYRRLPDKVEIVDENKIPEAYRVPQPDKILLTPIKKAIQDGEEVTGAKLETGRIKFEVKK